HLKTKATTGNPPEREAWKWQIIRGLYERGLTKTDVIKLFKIIDTMMTLPKELQTGLVRKIRSFEEERKMPLISPTEQLAMERGEQRGLEQGLEQGLEREQQLIIKLLNRRLGGVEPSQLQAIYTLNFDQLDLLGEALLDFSCVADLQQWLESQSQ
ncbi:DUF4351 domain-containing protein, partial [Anabaenopsis elenkinii]